MLHFRTKSSDGSLMMSVFSAAVSTMTISGKPSAVLLPGRSNSSVGTDDNSGGSGGSGGDGSGGDGSLGDADTFG